jgi:hypothetical protein
MKGNWEDPDAGFRTGKESGPVAQWPNGRVAEWQSEATASVPLCHSATVSLCHFPTPSYRPHLASFALDLGQFWQSRDLGGRVV